MSLSMFWLTQIPNWRIFEEQVFRPVWAGYASAEPDRRVVVIDIDERSLREVGSWPWPRKTLAALIERTMNAGASTVLIDMVLPETKLGDQELAKTIGNRPIVFGQIFSTADERLAFANSGRLSRYASTSFESNVCPPVLIAAGSFLGNHFATGVRMAGHISPAVDPDGVIRRIPALICFRGVAYPALPLAGISALSGTKNGWQIRRAGFGVDQSASSSAPHFWNRIFSPAFWIENPGLPGIRLPLESDGLTRIPFSRQRSAYASISASTVLKSRELSLDNAIVLIGSSAFGVSDSVPLPLSGLAVGMEVHLQMISSLLDSKVVYRPATFAAVQLISWILITVLLFAVWKKRLGFSAGARQLASSILVAPVIVILMLGLHYQLFKSHGVWLFSLELILYPILVTAGLLVVRQWQLSQQRNIAIAHLQAFTGSSVLINRLSQRLGGLEVQANQGESLDRYLERLPEPQITPMTATIVFADLRGFTAMFTQYPEQAVLRVMHQFYGTVDLVVRDHQGVVDKFFGDAFMAMFSGPDHAQRAVQAAMRLRSLLLNNKGLDGITPLDLHLGIDSGQVMWGLFGSGQRLTHTAFGRSVNQASRLEALTRELGHAVLISEQTYEGIQESRVRDRFTFVGRHAVAGVSDLVGVFALTESPQSISG